MWNDHRTEHCYERFKGRHKSALHMRRWKMRPMVAMGRPCHYYGKDDGMPPYWSTKDRSWRVVQKDKDYRKARILKAQMRVSVDL